MSFLAVISYTLLMRLHSVMPVVLLYHLNMSQVLQRLHMLRCGRPQLRDNARRPAGGYCAWRKESMSWLRSLIDLNVI